MDLGLAGALSGAGEAGSKALGIAQVQYGAQKLEDSRQALEDLRQQRLFEHQEKMQAQTEAAAEKRLGISEAGAEKRLGITEAGAEKRLGISEAGADRRQGEQLATQRDIHREATEAQKEIARLHREVSREGIKATELTAVGERISGLDTRITTIRSLLADFIKTDPSSPETANLKALVESMEAQHNKLSRVFDARVADMQAKAGIKMPTEPSETKPTLPPFKMPPIGRTPGVVQTPLPSAQEQEKMRGAVQGR